MINSFNFPLYSWYGLQSPECLLSNYFPSVLLLISGTTRNNPSLGIFFDFKETPKHLELVLLF